MARRESRLARLEEGAGNHETGPRWWRIRKWLGHSLTAEQDAAVAALADSEGPYDPQAPVDSGLASMVLRGPIISGVEAIWIDGPCVGYNHLNLKGRGRWLVGAKS